MDTSCTVENTTLNEVRVERREWAFSQDLWRLVGSIGAMELTGHKCSLRYIQMNLSRYQLAESLPGGAWTQLIPGLQPNPVEGTRVARELSGSVGALVLREK